MGKRLRNFVIFLWLLSFALGIFGVLPLLDPSIALHLRLLESIYISLGLFTLSQPDFLTYGDTQDFDSLNASLQIARFLSPLVTVTTIISLVSSLLERAIKRIRVRLFFRGHAIVYGFNLRSRLICEDLARKGIDTIVLEPELSEDEIDWLRERRILFFPMSGADEGSATITKAERAKYLFAAYEEDATNMKILVRAYQRNKDIYDALDDEKKKRFAALYPTHCYVHFDDPIFRNLKFGGQFSKLSKYFELRIFNVYELSAKRLALSLYARHAQDALAGKSLHFAIVGLGNTGQAMVEQLIRMAYFHGESETTLTLFDEDRANWERLVKRYPILELDEAFYGAEDLGRLARLKDAIRFPKVAFHELPLDSALFASGKLLADDSSGATIRSAILCLGEATRNLALADTLLQQRRAPFASVFLRSDDPQSEIRKHIKSEIQRKALSNFPSQDEICTLRSLNEGLGEEVAQAIHEEYISELAPDAPATPSSAPWGDLDEFFKESNRRAATHMAIKASLLGIPDFDLADPQRLKTIARSMRAILDDPSNRPKLEMLAECEHNRWCAEKLLAEWTPGKRRNDALKRHPNLVPWSFDPDSESEPFAGYAPLTEADKQKDRANIEKIPSYLEAL